MHKSVTQLEHKIGDRVFHFTCDPLSPLSEVKDAMFQFLKYVGQIEDAAKAQADAAKANAEVNPEEPKENA